MKIILRVALLVLPLLAAGCGTVNTVARPEHIAADQLEQAGTYCASIPRVYSGVSYGVCRMYARPAPVHAWQGSVGTERQLNMWAADMLVSAALDTLLLPYTLYQQSRYGDIPLD